MNRVRNLETQVSQMQAGIVWGIRAIWGGAMYLAMQLWSFIANGGSLK